MGHSISQMWKGVKPWLLQLEHQKLAVLVGCWSLSSLCGFTVEIIRKTLIWRVWQQKKTHHGTTMGRPMVSGYQNCLK